ncbi:hypothetical protein [Pseudonocardia adelaidensis]|uniref:DUF5667 domain-containing protein n=1 Tax=Pseudonocardia adelaidensis TaxID=648754 RepID=A0ABP9NMX5_9PSEU
MTRSGSRRRVLAPRGARTRTRATAVPRGPVPAAPHTATTQDVALIRLLSVVRLTPGQAVALGTDLVAGLEDRAGPARVPLRPGEARVGRDGRARVAGDPGNGAPPSANGAGLAAAAGLLDRLAAATRAGAPADQGLLAALERAGAEARSPEGRLAFVAAILRESDAASGPRARAELSRMVALVAGDAAPELTAAPEPRPRGPRRPPRRRPRSVARAAVARSWKWVLSVVLLGAIVVTEIAFLHDQINQDVQTVLDAGRSGASTDAPPLPPVAPAAPPAAGTITRVDLRPVQPCTPGGGCALRTQLAVAAQPQPQTITWDLRIVDRCTGAASTAPGGTVTVPPDADRADAVSTVALPEGRALAVVAVTNQPFVAASGPVAVTVKGAGDGACAN